MTKKSNVVQFKPKSEQQESKVQELSPEAQKRIQEVQEILNQDVSHIEAIKNLIDQQMLQYAEQAGENRLDISIPLQAMAQLLIGTAQGLDRKVLPDVLEEHRMLRMQIAEVVGNALHEFIQQHNSPIYTQDIYIGMAVALLSEITQNRVYQIVKKLEEQDKQDVALEEKGE
jgi:hypothetical protein